MLAVKGISPFIATVLLIAFTVAIGALISVWFTNVTSSQTQTVQSGSDALSKCASTSMTVNEVRYAGNGSSSLVNVTVSSSGTQSLKNVTISVTGGGATTTSQKFFNATGNDFLAGTYFATSMNTSGGASLPPEIVSVSGLCQGQQAIVATCKTGDSCMKPQ